MITPRELKKMFEEMEAEGRPEPKLPQYDITDLPLPPEPLPERDETCSHTYFDGRSAWKKLGHDRKDNFVSQCSLCGEISES